MKSVFILLLSLLSFNLYAQKKSSINDFNSTLTLSSGQPNYRGGDEGLTYGIDYMLDINDKWELVLFFQQHRNSELRANRHSHIGINLGRRHTFFSRVHFSYGFGFGNTIRYERYSTRMYYGPVMNGIFGPYRNYTYIGQERKSDLLSTSMKLNLGIKITDHLSIGTFMRTSWGEGLNFATVNGYLGVHF